MLVVVGLSKLDEFFAERIRLGDPFLVAAFSSWAAQSVDNWYYGHTERFLE